MKTETQEYQALIKEKIELARKWRIDNTISAHKIEKALKSDRGIDKILADFHLSQPKEESKEITVEEIDKEAESRYPVTTHESADDSPYVGSKKTFIHGVNWVLNKLAK